MREFEKSIREMRKILKILAACVLFFARATSAQTTKPVKLECESLITPLGMDAARPRLSWKMQDARPGARQTAYEIQVGSTVEMLAGGKGDVWDSGRVESDDSQ